MHNTMRAAVGGILLFVLAFATGVSGAQENNSEKKPEQRKLAPAPAYHLEFALDELEAGKKINTREYSVNVVAERQGDPGYIRSLGYNPKVLKIGTRVPVATEAGKFEYIDVGTQIRCKLVEDEAGLSLDADAEVSSFASRDPDTRNPILRDLSINATTAIVPGKLISLGTVDDPDSKRQFQFEVTATKLR